MIAAIYPFLFLLDHLIGAVKFRKFFKHKLNIHFIHVSNKDTQPRTLPHSPDKNILKRNITSIPNNYVQLIARLLHALLMMRSLLLLSSSLDIVGTDMHTNCRRAYLQLRRRKTYYYY